jgi:hypothetical protein
MRAHGGFRTGVRKGRAGHYRGYVWCWGPNSCTQQPRGTGIAAHALSGVQCAVTYVPQTDPSRGGGRGLVAPAPAPPLPPGPPPLLMSRGVTTACVAAPGRPGEQQPPQAAPIRRPHHRRALGLSISIGRSCPVSDQIVEDPVRGIRSRRISP